MSIYSSVLVNLLFYYSLETEFYRLNPSFATFFEQKFRITSFVESIFFFYTIAGNKKSYLFKSKIDYNRVYARKGHLLLLK